MVTRIACKILALATLLDAFQPLPSRRVPSARLRATTYEDQIASYRATLRAPKDLYGARSDDRKYSYKEEIAIAAFEGLEKACEERSRVEGASAGAAIADKLTGAWRAALLSNGTFVAPFPAGDFVETIDLPGSIASFGFFKGDWAVMRFFGPLEFDEESRNLSFAFMVHQSWSSIVFSASNSAPSGPTMATTWSVASSLKPPSANKARKPSTARSYSTLAAFQSPF